jgi:hypothetical protein
MGVPFAGSGVILFGPGGLAALAAVMGEFGNGSARCGGVRHPLLLGVDACRCASPTIVGASGNGSAWCGGGQHPPSSRRGSLPVHASLCRGRVNESTSKGSR